MQLTPNQIHIWKTCLNIGDYQESERYALLNQEERARADRFRFPIHRQHFIAARSGLRQILSQYLKVKPENLVFAYSAHQKPMLQSPGMLPLQFNLTHSGHIAAYAITLNYLVGIDIEKTKMTYDREIAKRFFSVEENMALDTLPENEKTIGFYRLWARKEAIIKAIGKGLSLPLSCFTVSASDCTETIYLENAAWQLMPLSLHPDYQAALACNHPMNCDIIYFNL